MKNIVIGATAVLAMGFVSNAYAAELNFIGMTEYGVESNVFEFEAGVDVAITDDVSVVLVGKTDYSSTGTSVDFKGGDLTLNYKFNESVNTYVRVDFDKDFDKNEVVIGADFRF